MNVLLIQSPVSVRSPHSHLAPPLGLAYVATHLIEAGHKVELIDLNVAGLNFARLDLVLKRFSPDIVGVSAYTEMFPNALRIARHIKEKAPHTWVMFGGAHPTLRPQEALESGVVDFVVLGEGEQTAVELLEFLGVVKKWAVESGSRKSAGHSSANENLPDKTLADRTSHLNPSERETLKSTKGLAFVDGDSVVITDSREPMHADEIGVPARDLLSLQFYDSPHNLLTARGGCPYRCPFCSASQLWSGKRRTRPVEQIMDEIDLLVGVYGATKLFFVDDIFTLDKKWTTQLLNALIQRKKEAPEYALLTWGCATRVDLVDDGILDLMAQAGCEAIQFGVESGSQTILDSVKNIEKAQAAGAVRGAVAHRIEPLCSFMIPFPDDTAETIHETGEFMAELQDMGAKILLSYTTPYPGTKFLEEAGTLGLQILDHNWEAYDAKRLIMKTKNLDRPTLQLLITELTENLALTKS